MERLIQKVQFSMPKQPKLKRVAAYARVSNGKDAMCAGQLLQRFDSESSWLALLWSIRR